MPLKCFLLLNAELETKPKRRAQVCDERTADGNELCVFLTPPPPPLLLLATHHHTTS
jgi:hypothetical protein